MIARLAGKLISKQPPLLLIDVGGIGYELEAPMSTFYQLPEPGESVVILTHLVIRDDGHILFGFSSEAERSLFRRLIKISGVGPKMALMILSGIRAADFVQCVQNRDAVALTRLPGIGKKTAERLIVEMQDQFDKNHLDFHEAVPSSPIADAISALVALGYKPIDANRMIKALNDQNASCEQLIRKALKHQLKS